MEVNKKISDFLSDKKAVIITTQNLDKTAWKKALKDFGIKINNIHNFDGGVEALEFIRSQGADIILCNYFLSDGSGREVLIDYAQTFPNKNKKVFLMFADSTSMALSALCAEEEADGLMVRPFTVADVEQKLHQVLMTKISLDPYYQLIGETRELLAAKKYFPALQKIEDAKKLNKKPTMAFCMQGAIYFEQGDFKEARECWKKAIELEPLHHRTLRYLFELNIKEKNYQDAFQYLATLFGNFPVNPDRIPDMLKVALATKNYDVIGDFVTVLSKVESDLQMIQLPLAAGLSLSSKYLLPINPQKAKIAALTALKLSDEKPQIMQTALETLIEGNAVTEAMKFIESIPSEDQDDMLKTMELRGFEKTNKPMAVFKKAVELKNKGVVNVDIFTVLIKSAQGSNVKQSMIDDFIHEAKKKFPEHKSRFDKFKS